MTERARGAGGSPTSARKTVGGFETLAKLNHPNIVQAYDAGFADGYYYFAMENIMIASDGAVKLADLGIAPADDVPAAD